MVFGLPAYVGPAANGTGLTIGAGVTVAASGMFGQVGDPSKTLVNRGTIRAEVARPNMWVYSIVTGSTLTNEGLIETAGGGTANGMFVQATQTTNAPPGRMVAKDNGQLKLGGSLTNQGDLEASGTGTLKLAATVRFQGEGRLVDGGGRLLLSAGAMQPEYPQFSALACRMADDHLCTASGIADSDPGQYLNNPAELPMAFIDAFSAELVRRLEERAAA